VRPVQVPVLPAHNLQNQTISTLHDVNYGYQTDLEITKQAYDSRIEVSSLKDLLHKTVIKICEHSTG